jgi:hypothetical protein
LEHDRLSKQPNESRNKPSCIALPHEFDGIAFLNILSGSVRQRLLQELTEARYGSGCSWRNISPAMIPHSVRNWWDFNRPLMVRLFEYGGPGLP